MRDEQRALTNLGFNELEAEVYLHLLPNPPATAYAVGKALGRPTANVYKAVEVLARKGAVLIEEGENRLCRAVPLTDFLQQARLSFNQLADDAASRLAHLESAPPDERVYRIDSIELLFGRARTLIESSAQTVVVIDAFPKALNLLQPSIVKAVARGIDVFVEAYTPVDLPGASVAHASVAVGSPEYWGAEQLNIIADGKEHLLALLSRDLQQIHQAVYSSSLYLSCLHHSGRLCEHTLLRLFKAADEQADAETMRAILRQHRFFSGSNVPGQIELLARFKKSRGAPL